MKDVGLIVMMSLIIMNVCMVMLMVIVSVASAMLVWSRR